ncbi:MAG: hypothetical protein ACR5KW_00170 [Wolbachia sp.]
MSLVKSKRHCWLFAITEDFTVLVSASVVIVVAFEVVDAVVENCLI